MTALARTRPTDPDASLPDTPPAGASEPPPVGSVYTASAARRDPEGFRRRVVAEARWLVREGKRPADEAIAGRIPSTTSLVAGVRAAMQAEDAWDEAVGLGPRPYRLPSLGPAERDARDRPLTEPLPVEHLRILAWVTQRPFGCTTGEAAHAFGIPQLFAFKRLCRLYRLGLVDGEEFPDRDVPDDPNPMIVWSRTAKEVHEPEDEDEADDEGDGPPGGLARDGDGNLMMTAAERKAWRASEDVRIRRECEAIRETWHPLRRLREERYQAADLKRSRDLRPGA